MQKSVLLAVVTIFTLLTLSFISAVAQETDGTLSSERLVIETKDKDGPANKGLKLEKEPAPRLPNGFGPLVDGTQKEQIYSIQREYNGLIAMLKLRVALLEDERDDKVHAVLKPSQLEKVKRPARRAILPARQ
jgi:hypothetical protein